MSAIEFSKYQQCVREFLDQLMIYKQHQERIRFEDKHTNYCVMWFIGTGEWGCHLSYDETCGMFCEDLGKCGYLNESLDLSD